MFSILENFGRVFTVRKENIPRIKISYVYFISAIFDFSGLLLLLLLYTGHGGRNRLLLYTVVVVFLPIEFPVEYPSYH